MKNRIILVRGSSSLGSMLGWKSQDRQIAVLSRISRDRQDLQSSLLKTKEKTSKDRKKAFSFPYTAESLSHLRHTRCAPKGYGTALAPAVCLQGLCVACPQMLACPHRPWHCCVWYFCGCLISYPLLACGIFPGVRACRVLQLCTEIGVLLKEDIPRFWSWQRCTRSSSTQNQCTERANELKRQIGWEESTMLPGTIPSLPGE